MEPTTASSEQGVADYDGPQLVRETRGIREQADRLLNLTGRIREQLDQLAKSLDPVLSPMDVPGLKAEDSPRGRSFSAVAAEASDRCDELDLISARIGNLVAQVDV